VEAAGIVCSEIEETLRFRAETLQADGVNQGFQNEDF